MKPRLTSLLKTDYPNFEVIFVDNASVDGSIDLIKNLFGSEKNLKIIQNRVNLGFAEGNNVGLKASKTSFEDN